MQCQLFYFESNSYNVSHFVYEKVGPIYFFYSPGKQWDCPDLDLKMTPKIIENKWFLKDNQYLIVNKNMKWNQLKFKKD